MTGVDVSHGAAGVGRLGTAAAWVCALSCLPYLVLKALWTVGLPVGISDESVLEGSGWVAGNAIMAVVQLAALALVVALVRPWARRLPAWLLLFPAWLGTGLLFQVAVGASLAGLFLDASQDSAASTGPFRPWVYVLVYSAFAVQGATLAVAFACHVRARWGRPLGGRTGELLAGRTVRLRSWPENHLAEIALTVSVTAFVTAVVFSSWSGGGAFALSGTESPSRAMQVARVAGAALAVLGLSGLAGRWGRRTRLWLPAALTWIGSGALVAFDGTSLLMNGLFAIVGTSEMSEASWELTDTALLAKVLVGALAAAVGVVACTSAVKDETARVRLAREAV